MSGEVSWTDRWAALWRRVRPVLPDLRDLHIYGGVAVAGYGVGQFSTALAWAFVGATLLAIGVWGVPPAGRTEQKTRKQE